MVGVVRCAAMFQVNDAGQGQGVGHSSVRTRGTCVGSKKDELLRKVQRRVEEPSVAGCCVAGHAMDHPPAKADTRIIIRTTLGLHGLQQLCNTLPLPICSVVGSLADPLNQLFLITTPLNATTFLNLVRVLPGIVDAELDQLASLLGGLNRVTTPPDSLSNSTLVTYYNSKVWNGYVTQPAAQIVRVAAAQHQFNVAGSGIVADIDTGVDPNHPAFAGVLLQGYDFTRNQSGASELNDLSPSDFPNLPPLARLQTARLPPSIKKPQPSWKDGPQLSSTPIQVMPHLAAARW
jgi:hypothetical protein